MVALAQAAATPYPKFAPLEQYLIADPAAEIALARSGAPASISGDAEIKVLTRDGYKTAVAGKNGFMCLVERGWGNTTDNAEFYSWRLRAPICFNAAAARTNAALYELKTKMVLAGKSKAEIVAAQAEAMKKHAPAATEPGAMCYMMSKQQYLNDTDKAWHPHMMFFVAGDTAKSWGADEAGSPVMSSKDLEEGVTIMMVLANKWSDGTSYEAMKH